MKVIQIAGAVIEHESKSYTTARGQRYNIIELTIQDPDKNIYFITAREKAIKQVRDVVVGDNLIVDVNVFCRRASQYRFITLDLLKAINLTQYAK